jgi:molecular chaperone GrpE
MITRVRHPSGSHHSLRLHLGLHHLDLPVLELELDERAVIAAAALVTGALVGAAGVTARNTSRLKSLRRHVAVAQKEVDSTRVIAMKDVEAAKQFGAARIFKDLLPTCDNLDRALTAAATSASGSISGSLSGSASVSAAVSREGDACSLHSGIELTRKELLKVLAVHGVKPIPIAVGDKFSPDLCEAMMTKPLRGLEESVNGGDGDGDVDAAVDTVSDVFLPGYTLHDRVIRPVQVSVYKDDMAMS